MNSLPAKYVLDANVFIQAYRRFYGLDFCPGYWSALIWHQRQGNLCGIDKVRDELEKGGDDLWTWAETQFGESAFVSTREADVTAIYGQMLAWTMAQPQFMGSAKSEFQAVADGWLAAYAKVSGRVVVTMEQLDYGSKRRVPLPNVCRAFDVEFISPFEMLRRLQVQLSWQSPR